MNAGIQIGEVFISQEDYNTLAGKVTAGFMAAGAGRGSAVGIMLRNDVPFLAASTAARNVGAYPVPINWHLKGDEVRYILDDSESSILVIHSDLLKQIRESLPPNIKVIVVPVPPYLAEIYELDMEVGELPEGAEIWNDWLEPFESVEAPPQTETSSMIYTSGTTGRPKGVKREAATPEQYQASIMAAAKIFGIQPGIRTVIPAPLYHTAPNAYASFVVLLGGFVVLQPRFDAEEFLALVEKYKLTHIQMVPVMFSRLLKLPETVRNKYDLSSLEFVIHAAAPCPPQMKKAMMDWWGDVIYEYYGSTELGALTFCTPDDAKAHPGTVGKPVEGATVKIFDEDGKEVATNEIGIVHGRLEWISDFTYKGDDAKRKSVEHEGLITGGDMGYFNDDGFLFLCDRATDMVISGGVNIYPAEIEGVLIDLEGVYDCAVFGIPDDDYGEALAAIIQLQPGAEVDADTVRGFLRERMAGYKVPKVVEFRDELPREDSGKLFKRKLRDEFWAGTGRKI